MIVVLKNYIIEVDTNQPASYGEWVYDSLDDLIEGSPIIERATGSLHSPEYGWFKIVKHQPFHNQPELDDVYTYDIRVTPSAGIIESTTGEQYAEVVNSLLLNEYINLKVIELANLLSPNEKLTGDKLYTYNSILDFFTEQGVVEVVFNKQGFTFIDDYRRELFNLTFVQN
jgi:hypothetical protein